MSGTRKPPNNSSMPPMDDEEMPVRRNPMDKDDEVVAPVVAPAVMPRPVAPVIPNGAATTASGSNTSPSMNTNYAPRPSTGGNNSGGDANAFYANIAANQESRPPDHWVKAYWRPAAAWLYMLICLMDFVVFPALTMILPGILKGFGVAIIYTPWQSLSLANGGLIHVSFGAIIGVAAWSRGKEKIADKN